jgi:CheY-like chemotaxis protein
MDTNLSREPAPGRSMHLLLVEDHPASQRLVRSLLETWGYMVTAAGTAREALQLAGQGSFDLVLLDVQLPDQDGCWVARRLRERENGGKRTPILALTAGSSPAEQARCLAAGMDGRISKPFDLQELLDALEQAAAPAARPRCELPSLPGAGETKQRPEPDGEGKRFEERRALARVGGDRVFLYEMIEDFLMGVSGRLGRLRQVWQQGDLGSLEREAHQWRGHLGQFSGLVARRAADLEQAARTGDASQQERAWERLRDEVEQLIKELGVWADQEGEGCPREVGGAEPRAL